MHLCAMSDSLQPYGLQPTRLLCPWNSPGKNTGLPFPSPEDLPDPRIKLESPALQADSLPFEPPEKSCIYVYACVYTKTKGFQYRVTNSERRMTVGSGYI